MNTFTENMSAYEMRQKIMSMEKAAFNRGVRDHLRYGKSHAVGVSQNCKGLAGKLKKASNKSQPSLLIIDDENDFRQKLRGYFEAKGFKVMEAENSKDGIQWLVDEAIDIVIVEARLNGEDGIETIVTISHEFPETSIVCTSRGGWYGTDIDFDIAEKMGARTLAKPFQLRTVKHMVNQLLHENK